MKRGFRTWLSYCFSVLFAVGCGSSASGEVVADENSTNNEFSIDDVFLEWGTDSSQLTISISAPTTGWIAVGFEPSAAMKDADIIIGYVSADEAFIRDDWGDGFVTHKADTELGGANNVTLVSGREENGRTELIFTIPLSSGDSFDKNLTSGQTFEVILAYGRDDDDSYEGMHAWVKKIEIEL